MREIVKTITFLRFDESGRVPPRHRFAFKAREKVNILSNSGRVGR